jgi:hypothetical protein
MPSFRNVLLGTGFTSLVGGAVAYSYKQNLISARRQDLQIEKEALQRELRNELSKVSMVQSEIAGVTEAEIKRRAAFQTIWDDRIARYNYSNLEAASFLDALPEALGATKGLLNHYRYAGEELRHFVGFDIASSKVHNFALLHQGLSSDPLHRASALKGLFASEPLISEVGTTLELIVPESTGHYASDVTKTFEYCLSDLEKRIELAAKLVTQETLPSHHANNMLLCAADNLLEKFKLPIINNSEKTLNEERTYSRSLRTAVDVRCALQYADEVLCRLSKGSGDASVETLRCHALVREGAEQLAVWQSGAAQLLVEQQAAEALGAYQSLLALSLAQSRDE